MRAGRRRFAPCVGHASLAALTSPASNHNTHGGAACVLGDAQAQVTNNATCRNAECGAVAVGLSHVADLRPREACELHPPASRLQLTVC
jgi:hypothetical protein